MTCCWSVVTTECTAIDQLQLAPPDPLSPQSSQSLLWWRVGVTKDREQRTTPFRFTFEGPLLCRITTAHTGLRPQQVHVQMDHGLWQAWFCQVLRPVLTRVHEECARWPDLDAVAPLATLSLPDFLEYGVRCWWSSCSPSSPWSLADGRVWWPFEVSVYGQRTLMRPALSRDMKFLARRLHGHVSGVVVGSDTPLKPHLQLVLAVDNLLSYVSTVCLT